MNAPILFLLVSLSAVSGIDIPFFTRYRQPQAEPIDCEIEYGPFSACSRTCDGGFETRIGRVVREGVNGGRPCPNPNALVETRPCVNNFPCRQDCGVIYGEFGACSATCGRGTQTRRAEIIQRLSGGGRPCPPLRETRPCFLADCAQNCVVEYGSFSECNCEGTQSRTGRVIQERTGRGRDCDPLIETVPCNLPASCDPVDCLFECDSFSPCSVTCGSGGIQSRTCRILSQPRNGGRPCPTQSELQTRETQQCRAVRDCSVDCVVQYGPYDNCQCDGFQTKRGLVVVQPQLGGRDCPPLLVTKPCQIPDRCLPIDCLVVYDDFTSCDCSGLQTRSGQIVRNQANNGAPCPPLQETQTCQRPPQCDPQDCVVDCEPYSSCSASCGFGGVETRECRVVQEARNGGRPCPQLFQSRPCATQIPCPRIMDCVVRYEDFSQCSCQGVQQRRAIVVQQPLNGGRDCPPLLETRPCQRPAQCDPVDCAVRCEDFSGCTASCGQGVQTRVCRVIEEPRNGGRPCPPLLETRPCTQTAFCPQPRDCVVQFPSFDSIPCPCEGVRTRFATVVQEPANGGRQCPSLRETEPCSPLAFQCDPQDCVVEYGGFGPCSVTCGPGFGFQRRFGNVVVQPRNGGRQCPPEVDTRQCQSTRPYC